MKKTMKKILVALLVCSILMMSGCTSRTESESDPRPATEESSDTQAENEEVIEEEEPQSSENETNDEDQQPSGSETSENPDENSASTQSADAGSFLYENSELGFSVQLPSCIEKNAEFTTDTRDDNGETVNIVSVTYQGESGQANILTLEEMSSQSWENMQKQNGPIPVELGSSENGRVVVMYPLQSNPFEPGTSDADVIEQFTKEKAVISESFTFLEK